MNREVQRKDRKDGVRFSLARRQGADAAKQNEGKEARWSDRRQDNMQKSI
jgi:hypothetical protein